MRPNQPLRLRLRLNAVIYEVVDDNLLTLRPVTAYDVPPPSPAKRRRKR
jgi:hypothetical protein